MPNAKTAMLREIIGDAVLLDIAHRAIEDELVARRDSRWSIMRSNGLCIREADGTPSSLIRMGPPEALQIGLTAIIEHLEKINA